MELWYKLPSLVQNRRQFSVKRHWILQLKTKAFREVEDMAGSAVKLPSSRHSSFILVATIWNKCIYVFESNMKYFVISYIDHIISRSIQIWCLFFFNFSKSLTYLLEIRRHFLRCRAIRYQKQQDWPYSTVNIRHRDFIQEIARNSSGYFTKIYIE